MKFKKLLQNLQVKGWAGRYIGYKRLKQILKDSKTDDDIIKKLSAAVFTRLLKKNIATVNDSYLTMREKLSDVLKKFSAEVERKLVRLQKAKEAQRLLLRQTYEDLLQDVEHIRLYCVINYLVRDRG